MDERHVEELFLASEKGSVSFLTTLIQRDPLILSKVSLTSRRNTPLHIATLLGHLEFCKILLSQKPTFAQEVNDFGRTPLHLASAVGHTEIVQALLEANTQVCFVYDLDEKIPLHLAAMKGRKEIVQVLISARPKSIQLDVNEESVLHLCVRYGRLDALKCLVESDAGKELLISKDRLGASILDLAVMLKQKKTIKYLLSVPGIERVANVLEIENILEKVDVRRSTDEAHVQPAQSTFRRWWGCVPSALVKYLMNPSNWIEQTRGSLMVVATVMATMSFQAGISPPGGVWQEDTKNDGYSCVVNNTCEVVGKAILSYYHPYYIGFLSSNTGSFLASVGVILLVICGFPLTSKYIIWLLSLAMTISVSSMTNAYLYAVLMVTSPDVFDEFELLFYILLNILRGVFGIAILTHIIHPLYWIVKGLRNFIRKSAAAREHKRDHTSEEVCEDDVEHP
ncbi:hypothetical protein FH972_019118 [Carpinus fangiana]|uniref:PGG domain-containing protein n=1 Tax=Carpinus fangiana TaxID=176857 RepID=A0A5N6RSP0_9ROSI|nr:hypothetical protein FH972_019118 [Carpinus fangiana]